MSNTEIRSMINREMVNGNEIGEMEGKHLTFWMDGQLCGISIIHVVQIIGMHKYTEIPDFPYYAKGIINLRGTIIPLIDIRLRLGRHETAYDDHTCIIVTSMEERQVGIIVDGVETVLSISEDLIVPPPKLAEGGNGYITGVGKLEDKVVLLMDLKKIIGNELSW